MQTILPDDFVNSDDLKRYTTDLIMRIKECKSLRHEYPQEFLFFRKLLNRHPEKNKKGVYRLIDIEFRKFPITKKIIKYSDIQIFIHFKDGKSDSISWSKCIKGEDNPIQQKLVWAMRSSIKEQVQEFKATQVNVPCLFCNTNDYLTVDHIIKFRDIAKDFIDLYPNHPMQFQKNNLAQEVFRDDKEDQEYMKKWQDYHRQRAQLRILCIDCNVNLENNN